LLMEKDKNGLQTFIHEEINTKILHPNLNLDELDEIPDKAGIYKFFDDANQLIYIGKSKHIRKRIDQHLRNTKTLKGNLLIKDIARIEHELTGSELIALLLESTLIKKHQPKYNRALRKNLFPYGLYHYIDSGGYVHFHIASTSKYTDAPLASFSSKKEGVNQLEKLCEKYELCQKLCELYPTQSSCFHYEIKQCKGACIQLEDHESYNVRADQLIDDLSFNGDSFYILDKGRHKSERSLVLIERGSYAGYGYAPFHFHSKAPIHWKTFISITNEDRDARSIINVFMRKNDPERILF